MEWFDTSHKLNSPLLPDKGRDYGLRSQFSEREQQWNKKCTIIAAVLITKVYKKRRCIIHKNRCSPPPCSSLWQLGQRQDGRHSLQCHVFFPGKDKMAGTPHSSLSLSCRPETMENNDRPLKARSFTLCCATALFPMAVSHPSTAAFALYILLGLSSQQDCGF